MSVCTALQRLCVQARAVAEAAVAAPGADAVLCDAVAALGLCGGGGGGNDGTLLAARRARDAAARSGGDSESDGGDGEGDGDDDGSDDEAGAADAAAFGVADGAPAGFDGAAALAQLRAVRALAPKWLPLMCKVFLEVRQSVCGCAVLID